MSDSSYSLPKEREPSKHENNVPFKGRNYDDPCLLNALSTHFLICTEKTTGKGEDSGLEIYNTKAGICSVCDGCGGSGFMLRNNMTDAYFASRVTQNACRLWFQYNCEHEANWDMDHLKKLIISCLRTCRRYIGEPSMRISGSMVKTLPTTLAGIVCWTEQGNLISKHFWAGDSRNYLLDQNGLCQITVDDSQCQDAMENLTRDATLTNIISADEDFAIHSTIIVLSQPCVLFSASDGCFSYISSPMEFELLLLKTLLNADSIDTWESSLRDEISCRAGDDQTLALSAYGFASFPDMKAYYAERYQFMNTLLNSCGSNSEQHQQYAVWKEYKPDYYRYISELE